MNWPVAKAIFVLPGTGVVFIPAVLLWVSQNTRFAADVSGPRQIPFWFAVFSAVLGLILLIWTISLFAKRGRGTLAPWEPPKRLVVEEKSLERRFGEEYLLYQKNVPRWVPRLRPWTKGDEKGSETL